ncbi:hypothetical protein ACJRO7_014641 [Eucalyptus globulus]|uniref:Uncharacterized protein n=1 Tax=Eucalyptus globulus TaxID=34317 RepID=A0ABD3L1U1_EUCGL
MNKSCITKLPMTIGMWEKLEEIHGEDCLALQTIPSDIARLFLENFQIDKNSSVVLDTNLRNLKLSFPTLMSIIAMKMDRTYNPWWIGKLLRLEYLRLGLPSITSIPSDLDHLCCLKELLLVYCKNLRHIGPLPSSLRKLTVSHCSKLLELSLSFGIPNIQGLKGLRSLQFLKLSSCEFSNLGGLERLENLLVLSIELCPLLHTLPNLSNLKYLKDLSLLESLLSITIRDCSSLQSLANLSNLKKLENCGIECCSRGIPPGEV